MKFPEQRGQPLCQNLSTFGPWGNRTPLQRWKVKDFTGKRKQLLVTWGCSLDLRFQHSDLGGPVLASSAKNVTVTKVITILFEPPYVELPLVFSPLLTRYLGTFKGTVYTTRSCFLVSDLISQVFWLTKVQTPKVAEWSSPKGSEPELLTTHLKHAPLS